MQDDCQWVTGTACPQRLNGNMPVEQVAQKPTQVNWTVWHGMIIQVVSGPTPLLIKNRTDGVFTICMEMYGSGVGIGIAMFQGGMKRILQARYPARHELSVAEDGTLVR